jgi:alpha-D-xyloside xylohydrolase
MFATIPLHWDDAHSTLTIGDRKGLFPGMLTNRAFHVVLVSEKHGIGIESAEAGKVVQYSGKQVLVTP